MDIQFIVVPPVDQMADGQDLTIMVDNETVIRVRGYATEKYQWRVDSSDKTSPEYDPMGTIQDIIGNAEDGWFTPEQTFGKLATYWDERTFAHAVMDTIRNC